jgi:hypothetical protein
VRILQGGATNDFDAEAQRRRGGKEFAGIDGIWIGLKFLFVRFCFKEWACLALLGIDFLRSGIFPPG